MIEMYNRSISLPSHRKNSFFLWGSRQSGKTTLLKKTFKDVPYIDLLKTDEYTKYLSSPKLLREELLAQDNRFAIIDEVQKVPTLLDEVHWLIENANFSFALCGSSARKLKRGHANLLGGRALRYELFGLSAQEIGPSFDLKKALNRGYMPRYYDWQASHEKITADQEITHALRSYCNDYLKEEIFSEGLVRKLPLFSNFLELAALGDTEILSYESFARDCGVSAHTIKSYFDILSDTLLGHYLPAYVKRPKRRVNKKAKFYFADVGVVNALAKRGMIESGSELYGRAFENWVHHELRCYLSYSLSSHDISYWGLSTGVEVDFIIGNLACAIEAKSSSKIHSEHLKGLKELKKEYPQVKNQVVVCNETSRRKTSDDILIVPAKDFISDLWGGKLF